MDFGKGLDFLEDHAHAPAQRHDVHGPLIDVLAVEQHAALDPDAFDQIVHAIEHAQERDLPQPEGPINAVTWFGGISIVMSCRAWVAP